MTFDSDTLAKKASKSAFFNVIAGLIQLSIRLSASFILARQLTPNDFGLMGMCILIYNLALFLGNVGIGAGIIALQKPTSEQLSTAFWLIFATRFFLFLAAFASAHHVALFFGEPVVERAIQAMSFTILLSILGSVGSSLLNLKFRYKELLIIKILAIIIESGSAICLVMTTDFGFWALIISMIIGNVVLQLSIFIVTDWKPQFIFSTKSYNYFKSYMINGLGNSLSMYFTGNLDYLIIGRMLGATQLGLYEFAFRIPSLIKEKFVIPVGGVLLPVFSLVKTEGDYAAKTHYKIVRLIGFIIFPMLFCFSAVSGNLIPFLWGNQWLSIVPLIKIISAAIAIGSITDPVGSIFNAYNRPDLVFKMNMLHLIATASLMLLFGVKYKLVGISFAILLGYIPNFIFMVLGIRMIKGNAFIVSKEISLIAILSIECAVLSWWISGYTFQATGVNLLAASVGILVYGINYIMGSVFFFKPLLNESINILKKIR